MTYDGREVKLIDSMMWALSRRGDVSDWDFFPAKSSPDMACAGSIGHGAKIYAMHVLSDELLLFDTSEGIFLMEGNPCDGGLIRELERP